MRWALFRYLSPTYIRLYGRLMLDSRVPLSARILVWLSLIYVISPIDLIPDWIVIVGWLDDLALLVLPLMNLVRATPRPVMAEHMARLTGGG